MTHEHKPVNKCSYCGRTEICEGSYPEGCFLENEMMKPTPPEK